jgi:DNA modification methylase
LGIDKTMNTIPRKSIIILPNRQRQDFEPNALQELKNSIEDRGLLHPIVLRRPRPNDLLGQLSSGATTDMILVAGERRLRAIDEIFELGGSFCCNGQRFQSDALSIPYTDLGDLSELEAEEAELDENLRRRDLTWQEHAAAVERLHALRSKQAIAHHAELTAGSVGNPVPAAAMHTVADTAEEVTGKRDGWYQDSVRREIIVAKHLATNPEVAKAKSVDEAFKILKQQETRAKNVELARVVGQTFSTESHKLFNVDCLQFMQGYIAGKNELFDVILTDPPYGIDADQFGDGAGKLQGITHEYDDSYEAWLALMQKWTVLAYQVCKPQAHAYVFCDIDRFHELKAMMEAAGWYVFRTPLIVYKMNSGRVPLPDRGPRRQWEMILYAIKGGKPVTHIYPDVIACQADESMGHGAQKPVALFQNLLQRSVKPGDRLLDSFAGSGTLLEAGHTYKCYVVAIEQEVEAFGMCLARLRRMKEMEQPVLLGV